MTITDQTPEDDPDHPLAVLREVRDRFVMTFAARCEAVEHLADRVAQDGENGPLSALRQIVHRLSGLAGTIGFTGVSLEASALEALLQAAPEQGLDRQIAAETVRRLRAAFQEDLQRPAPEWNVPETVAPRAAKILVVEDDGDQARLLVSWLRHGGYRAIDVSTGEDALEVMADEHPDLVLLDVGLPGIDGYGVCQRVKANPDLTRTPVIFLTTRSSVDDRLLGLALGADDFIAKPADRHELLLRIRLRLGRRGSAGGSGGSGSLSRKMPRAMLPFEVFAMVVRAELDRSAGALALVRAPVSAMPAVTVALLSRTRSADVLCHYDRTHVVLFMRGMTPSAAPDRIRALLQPVVAAGALGVHAGVAARTKSPIALDDLIADADEALVTARRQGDLVATRPTRDLTKTMPSFGGTAIFTKGDPALTPVVDRMMRAAGFDSVHAIDTDQTVDAVQTEHPDVLLLDLMAPGLSSLDILRRLAPRESRPPVVLLTASGRDDDVARAFELGADDYVIKPFTSEELRMRVTRLLR
jgi:DNA-binding response OmpR family regulator/HPt (histidine-containing phosphotransfer) domain-containing protein